MDWFGNPWKAVVIYLSTVATMAVEFSLLMLLTKYVKLPSYRLREQ